MRLGDDGKLFVIAVALSGIWAALYVATVQQ